MIVSFPAIWCLSTTSILLFRGLTLNFLVGNHEFGKIFLEVYLDLSLTVSNPFPCHRTIYLNMGRFKTWFENSISGEEVLQLVQSSPQMRAKHDQIDWPKYAARWGLDQQFVKGQMRVSDLVQLVNNFRVRLSKSLDQNTIAQKSVDSVSGPVIITMPDNEPQPLAIVDGSHALVAAHNRGQQTISVIVSQPAAKWLGDHIMITEDTTVSAGSYDRRQDPEDRGLFEPEGKEYRPPPQSRYAKKIFGDMEDRPKTKKKSLKSRSLTPIA
jgi:hypothetical protein